MKNIFISFTFFFFFFNKSFCWDEKLFNKQNIPYQFSVHYNDNLSSNDFELRSDEVPPGRVKKSMFRSRTNYDLSSSDSWQARGSTQLLSFGGDFYWARQIDVYDTQNNCIGNISGSMLNPTLVCYSFFDEDNELIAYSCVDEGCLRASIVHPIVESRVFAELTRLFETGAEDSWGVQVFEPEKIDFRTLRIFSAFIADQQRKFKEDK